MVPVAAALSPGAARADSGFDGKWRQGPLREIFTVQRWLDGCGPPPTSSSTGGGETIVVRMEGDVLSFSGGGRVYRSNQCYDPLPSLSRGSYSHDPASRAWRTRCSTPPNDPRKPVMQTLVVATSDTHIEMTETGRYEISHEGGFCVADVRRSRGFDLIAPDRPAAPAPSASVPPPSASASVAPPTPPPPNPAPPPDPPDPPATSCANPGPPARLELRPSRKLLKTGESFVFTARVVDAKGCRTDTDVRWLASWEADKAKISVDPSGKVSVPDGVAEGDYKIIATAAGKTALGVVQISTPSNYDALLAQSGLNAAGESEAASVTALAGESIGGREVQGDDGRNRRRAIFGGIVGVSVVGLGIAYLVLRRRQRQARTLEEESARRYESRLHEAELRRKEKEALYQEQLQAHEKSVRSAEEARARAREKAVKQAVAAVAAPVERRSCPLCRRNFEGKDFCPDDGSSLVAMSEDPATGMICPVCQRGYPEGVRTCPEHKEELVPFQSRPGAGAASTKPARGKICPSCGDRFDGPSTFCGKDGTALVLIN